jgi:hypothetical protein
MFSVHEARSRLNEIRNCYAILGIGTKCANFESSNITDAKS